MSILHAILLGILEGLTEFLPVSSTGHLFLLGKGLGHEDDAAKTLEIVIQLGAVIAVVVYYRKRLWDLVYGVLQRDAASLKLASALLIAFVPAAGLGYLFHKKIKSELMSTLPVAGALIAGGVVMAAIEIVRKRRGEKGDNDLAAVTPKRAFVIGLSQCFSLWPGASRSMTTILGGQVAGLSTEAAAEFSFLLSIPTLGAATAYDLMKNGKMLLAAPGGGSALAVGMLVSFIVAIAVIAAFLRYLKRFGLVPFGVYRVILGALVIVFASRSAPDAHAHVKGGAPPASASAAPAGSER